MKCIAKILLLILFSSCLVAPALAETSYFSVLEKTSDALILEWEGPELNWLNVSINDKMYVKPVFGELTLLQQPGSPQLPVDAYALQTHGLFTIVVLDSVYEEVVGGRVLPSPTQRLEGAEQIDYFFIENEKIYQSSNYYPSSFVQRISGIVRDRSFGRIQVNPLKYNPIRNRVRVLRYLKLEIKSSENSNLSPSTTSDLDKRLAKYPRIGQSSPAISTSFKKTSSRITSVGPRVKIKLVDQGVYGITGAQLQTAGMSLALLQPQKIRLENRGVEQPCVIVGAEDGSFGVDDKVLFFGERLSGDGEFYHAYTDTNVYWLSVGESDGLRFTPGVAGQATEFVYSFPEALHFEQDREYYQGDTNADIQETETVPGEGWVWERAIDPGETFKVNFDLPGFVLDQDSVALKFRVRGVTRDSDPDAHFLRMSVNNKSLYERYFDDRDEIQPIIQIPADVLKDSANVLSIESVRQGDRASRFYFDWFEVDYERNLQANEGWLQVDSTQAIEPRIHWAGGFSSAHVRVWDIGKDQIIEPEAISQNWAATLRVESAAALDGNHALFYLENDLLYSGTRGISVVVLDSQNGEVIEKKTFDTFASAEQADSLAALLNALPDGALVLAGVRDDGANSVTSAAIQALQSIGSQEIDKLQYRQSWSFIAQKGSGGLLSEQRTESGAGAALASTLFTFEDSDSSYTVQFAAGAGDKMIVFDDASVKSPLSIVYKENDPISQIIGADYVIISHKKFLSEAQRLADYRRQHNSFQTVVLNVDDIYDAFNDGVFSPLAIQRAMKHASRSWMPGPSFLLLFGDATWDVKQRYSSTQFSNFVPSLGNPVSDALLVCFDGGDDILPDVSVGRIPATTLEDARAIIDKTIEYESAPSAAWKKNFLFISGGLDEDEQELFKKQSQSLVTEFVDAAPTFGNPIYISKEDEENEADERSLILDRINGGVLWTNFIGHAASRTWELMFNNPDIEDLTNQGRYTFVSSMTCHTGRFAEPNQESFGERFLLIPDKGAIGFWGTSGWGYSYEDYIYLQQLYPTVLADTVRYMGDVITLTKFNLWQKYGASPHFKNLILQYNLMGDPALSLTLPTKPDLTITSDDIYVSPGVPSEADSSAMIHVRVQNWGLAALDSTRIQLNIEHTSSHSTLSTDLMLPPVIRSDSSQYIWPLRNMAGAVDISAVVDPDSRIDEWDETNNQNSIQVTVLTSHLELVSPPQNSILPLDKATLKVQAPQQYFDENLRYFFQIDTSSQFDSPLLQASDFVRAHPLVIKWQPEDLLPQQRYFWRVYDAEDQPDSSFLATFTTTNSDSFGWRQNRASVAEDNNYVNTTWTSDGVRLDAQRLPILIQSAWTNSVGYSVIEVENQAVLQTSRGYNFAVLDQTNGKVLQAVHFDTYADVAAVGRMIEFLAGIDNGRLVLAAVSDEGFSHITEEAYQALESIGSAKIRDLQYRSVWAIIGKKGAMLGSVPEGLAPYQQDESVVLKDTLSVLYERGRVLSERIGPASEWSGARFNVDRQDSCQFVATVYGRQSVAGDTVRLLSDISAAFVDLSSINAQEFPFLTIAGNFVTQNGAASPAMRSWDVLFEPSPDIALSPQLFTQSADTVLVGQEVTFYLDLYNIGLFDARNVELVFEEGNKVNGKSLVAEIKVDSIEADRFAPVQQKWQSGAIPGLKTIFITADPQQHIAELSEANNNISTTVYVHADTLEPSISLTFDERIIYEGDLVSPTPLIIARVHDNNPTPLSDTTSINIYLDGRRMSFSQPGVLTMHSSDDSQVRGVVLFQPTLEDGMHDLIIEFDDVSHNSTIERIRFLVESDLAVRDALNYPNPFSENTEFRFSLSQQAKIQIKVFTVAGRLIQTIDAGSFPVGYNKIFWDGRDVSGDFLANGVYLYKISAITEGETVGRVSKIIVMR
jgi:hypothetical protein